MVAARERSSFVETNRDRGGHGLGDTLETLSFDRPSRAATLEVPETAYDRPQLVGMSTDRLQYGRYARPNSRFRR